MSSEKLQMEGAYLAPLSLIKPDADFNPRMGDIVVTDDMLASVKNVGIISPLQVRTKEGKPTLWLIDGCRRLKAAHMAKLKEVPVIQHDEMDDPTALVVALTSKDQQPFTPVEIRAAIIRLKKGGLTTEEIASNCGFSIRYVQEVIVLEEKGIKAVKNADLDLRVLSRIAQLEPDAQKAALKGAMEGTTREEATQAVRMRERESGIKKPGPPSSAEFPLVKDARRVLETLNRFLVAELKRHPNNVVRRGQLEVALVMKGSVDVDDFTGSKRKVKIEKQK